MRFFFKSPNEAKTMPAQTKADLLVKLVGASCFQGKSVKGHITEDGVSLLSSDNYSVRAVYVRSVDALALGQWLIANYSPVQSEEGEDK